MYRLREVHMFSKLSEKHLSILEKNTTIRSFVKDSIVFYEGDQGNHLYVVVEGTVKMYKTTPKGTQIQINRFEAPAVVGEYACFERAPYPATCEFISDGKIAMVPYEFIYRFLNNVDFCTEIIKSLTSKIMMLSSLIQKETIYSSEAKVAKILLEDSEIFSTHKYNEVASILNLTPETLSRIFKKMKKENIIEVSRHHEIKILDYNALEMVIENNKVKSCERCVNQYKNLKQ